MKALLSGNEAIARGAWEAGVKVAAAYPGTPSTEILQNIHLYDEIYAEWSANEKVSLDVAIGAAYAGQRALAAMKHVGLNVASESLFYASYTGLNAGLVIVTADDPGMHSSQNEQDNRHYARFAKVPMLEPADSQEAKDFTKLALELSERFDTPVLLRTTTRTSHAKSGVELGERKEIPKRPYAKDPTKYVMIPGYAKRRHPIIEERLKRIAEWAEQSEVNKIEWGERAMGIISCGAAYQYAREVFPNASFLKLGMVWPLPEKKIREFAAGVEKLYVVEELDPFIEEFTRQSGIAVEGKSIFPIFDEFTPERVRQAAVKAGLLPPGNDGAAARLDVGPLAQRPPILCAGCGHRDVFWVLRKLKVAVNSDIGCYALGVMPPLDATDTIGCMGASIGVAAGMRRGGLETPNVAILGDSTFFHSGLPALADAVYNQTPLVALIVDNRTTGMTGHQGNPGSGATLRGKGKRIDIPALVRALGVNYVAEVEARDLKGTEKAIREAIAANAPAAVVVHAICVFEESHNREPYTIIAEDCNGCTMCFRIGCPAISKSAELDEKTKRPKALIDPALCVGCGLCFDVCARQAIEPGKEKVKA